MDWKDILLNNTPTNLWYQAHDCMLHAHYWDHSDEFTLLFIHGAIANNIWWQHIAAQIKKGQIFSVDLSGHGLSDWDSPYTLSKHAHEIETLIDAYAKGPVYIIGHSYGGAVAALAAAHRQVEKAVMVDTPLHIALDQKAPSLKSYRKYVYGTRDEAISRFKPIPNQPILDQALLHIVANASIKEEGSGFTWQFDPAFHKRDVSLEDQDLIKPMLSDMSYWYGEYSPFATESTLNRAKAFGLSLDRIEKSYHAVMLDNPKQLLEKILNIL